MTSAEQQLLVLSDTHGNVPFGLLAAERFGHVDAIVHLGDHYDDAIILEDILDRQIIKVPGNCDYERTAPREITFTFGGLTFFICHGDRYAVKRGYESLKRRATDAQADVVLVGHTHLPLIESDNGILLVNPGALTRKDPASVAVVSVSAGVATSELFWVTD